MNNQSDNKDIIEMAYFRFSLIAPVIQGVFPDATKTAYYRRVTEKEFTLPNGKNMIYNPKTLEKWEEYYRKQGMDGLMPKSRSDAGSTRVLNDSAINEIYHLREKFPRINATLIYHKLIEDGFIKQSEVSVSSVQRFIKQNNLRSAVNLNQKDRKAFEEEYPCGMYQADTSYTTYIKENGKLRRTYLIHIIDDHSRLIVGARFFYNDNAYNFQLVLKEAISCYGLCKKLYLDNGSTYANTQISLICGSLGIVKLHTPIRDGASKAKVERSFRTVKDTWLNGLDSSEISSLEELNRLLQDYVRKRNTSINRTIGETPIDRYQRGINHVKPPKSKEWLDECFMNRIVRKVNNDATITIDSVSYDVPMQFIRSKVEIRYLPDHMQDAYILFEDKHYPLRITNRVENGRTKRNNTHTIDYSKMEDSNHV
ncbi:DDE-type integrase/transposase/recombinase [Clostridium sp. 19966]|uniref:DDE-type integrase/transposase/recombinase n=1 Tax=Clostridium sp. 19966 TaxID=2768166 RepID=UPI0028DF0EDC|nr:DDE-type integrase/transposase/recombinase [Clostridium sp. 19966]MDT8716026.1 DDE-type integrase/transposase/recombinase [Clostridium sp. 19966]